MSFDPVALPADVGAAITHVMQTHPCGAGIFLACEADGQTLVIDRDVDAPVVTRWFDRHRDCPPSRCLGWN